MYKYITQTPLSDAFYKILKDNFYYIIVVKHRYITYNVLPVIKKISLTLYLVPIQQSRQKDPRTHCNNNKYFISLNGNRTYNLSSLQSQASYTPALQLSSNILVNIIK